MQYQPSLTLIRYAEARARDLRNKLLACLYRIENESGWDCWMVKPECWGTVDKPSTTYYPEGGLIKQILATDRRIEWYKNQRNEA